MKNISPYKIILIFIAIILVAASIMWSRLSINRTDQEIVTNIANEAFNEQHYNFIITDTFINLLNKAYPGIVTTTKQNNELRVTLLGAGAVTKDFFNGNDNILKLDKSDFGFEIKYLQQENKIDATFVLNQNSVPVPNDVMIKLIDKTYNK